ncbi:homing endonuclease associated repeat-containing protein [Brachyspira aalborgi]|uniref:HNH endonuclease n=1 Tax=Brachyspira aalborgi TaxID=29522 RepID=A0A5C8CK37_9SPIR|nr:HNH endonuclease [Brachyspira aalborgi]TXJ12721.1 HNH endonuclease [Brachyspira aalborgi]
MEYILVEHHRNVSDEELIKDLKEVALKLGKDKVTIRQYETLGKYSGRTLINKFGSWNNSLKKAGLSITTRMNISEEELFQNLADLWQHFGRQPKFHEVRQPLSKFSAATYGNRFGSWYNALKAFIATMNGDIIDTKQTNNEKNTTNNPRSINYRIRFKVMQRDDFKCQICGASPAMQAGVLLHVDHIVPVAKGGQATMDNLQTLCQKCNLGKSDLDMNKS